MKLFTKLAILICLGVVLSGPVSAHTFLVESFPARDQVLNTFPKSIYLVFGEDLLTLNNSENNYFTLSSESGENLDISANVLQGSKLESNVLEIDPEFGKYYVNYRIVAGDGHVLKGSYSFFYKIMTNSQTKKDLQKPIVVPQKEIDLNKVSDDFDHASHDNFFSLHFEHIVMFIIPMFGILVWGWLRRRS